MPDPATSERYSKHSPQRGNFLVAVILSVIAFVVFAAFALYVLHRNGSHMLAPTHPNPQPHSLLRLGGGGADEA